MELFLHSLVIYLYWKMIELFFEILVGIIYVTKKSITIIKINKEEKKTIQRSFRTKLDTNLCPVRFAPGGKADIMIKNQINFINIEPTTQIKIKLKWNLILLYNI